MAEAESENQNKSSLRWAGNLWDLTNLRWDKLGINQLHSTCAFRISSCFLTEVKFEVGWNGKIWFYTISNIKSPNVFQTYGT